jgi:hypothetical protein
MKQKRLFLLSDAALREVVDQIDPARLEELAPPAWSRQPDPTMRSILAGHAKDEAWVPDVLAGRSIGEVGDTWDGDLLGDEPIGNYDRFNELATAAVTAVEENTDPLVHLSYGDYPVSNFFEHTSYFRAFQAWSIAKHLGIHFSLSPELVDLLDETATPQLDELRAIHVFGPAIEVPADADPQTQLLAKTGFWVA